MAKSAIQTALTDPYAMRLVDVLCEHLLSQEPVCCVTSEKALCEMPMTRKVLPPTEQSLNANARNEGLRQTGLWMQTATEAGGAHDTARSI